jgi:vancomycin resistance protein VanJ
VSEHLRQTAAVRLLRWLAIASVAAAVPSTVEARRGALRVLTYNLDYANPDFAATLDAIAAADADVVLLQEVSAAWRDALARRFSPVYPHRTFHIHSRQAGGLAVLSRLPVEHDELWAPPAGSGAWFPAERVVVKAPFGSLQLLNVHLRPARDRGGWLSGYMTTREVRRREIEAHWRALDRALPTVVAGDFNEEPDGRAVAYLAGQGLSRVSTTGPRTWRYGARGPGAAKPLLHMDIDHVMIDDRLVPGDARVLDAGTSDHRPVVVELAAK